MGYGETRVDVDITEQSLDGGDPFAGLGGAGDGAALVFVGRVRNLNEDRQVVGIEYEAYREMALKVLRGICERASAEHEVGHVRAVHRTGCLKVGEASVAVSVSAPHRAACYAASKQIMDDLKQLLPVWKKEQYADGSADWLGAPTSAQDAGA